MFARMALSRSAAAAAAVVAALATASTASAECANRYVTGEATGFFYATTGIAARSDWRRTVRRRYGGEFALWSRASNRTTRCFKPEGGGRWTCRAYARPCDR